MQSRSCQAVRVSFAGRAGDRVQRVAELDQLVFDKLGYPDLPEAFFHDIDLAFRKRSAFFVFPDVIPALDAMQEAGLRLGVVSNWGWHAPELLQTLELARHFEIMSISARVGYQKPHAAIFEHALDLLDIGPEQAVHVGDDPEADVLGARSVGIEPILIDRKGRLAPPLGAEAETGAVPTIHDFGDLLDLLRIERPQALAEAGA
ncbi:MAG: HAD family hydrolase, partial [Polyangiales bacterium]